ncbi:hypothetical protein EAX61_07065 [Dokdonia sinensis]|uniref:Peptidase M56 domain-containing protein n=1 Tax=Dokdonia sinensis TaxID=2479847 RepID=A0A3M0G6M1_9FLAO|nr:M56 family metallopeptidase [Dokdonia sinensis]RMB60575.1 hypothetical protein EAX61_07065 [Dokdonia sinensis]
METLTYIIKSIAILGIFYVIYMIVLRRDTFFTANRHYLIGGILAAILLPFLEFETITYVPAPVVEELPFINNFDSAQWETMTPAEAQFTIDWFQVLFVIYCIGVSVMITRFFIQLFSLQRLIKSGTVVARNRFTYIAVDQDITPFSFFKYIVYNPQLHSQEDQEMILAHEQVHASQLHSIDVLLTQVALALQWCNPIAWLYKNSIEQNLEYIADSTAAQQAQSHKKYQRTLVKVSSTSYRPALTTNFYHSFIKKRIVMLNKPASQRRNLLKLGLILPALALFMYSFHTKEVVQFEEVDGDNYAFAKPVLSGAEVAETPLNTLNVTIKKDFVLDDFNNVTVDLFTKGIVFTYGEVVRNENGTIASMYVITHPAGSGEQTRHTLKEKVVGKGIEDATLTFDKETLKATVTTQIATVDTFSIDKDGTVNRGKTSTSIQNIFGINSTSTASELDRIEKIVAQKYPESTFRFSNRKFATDGKLQRFAFQTKFTGQSRFFTRFDRNSDLPTDWDGYEIKITPAQEIVVIEKGKIGQSFKIDAEKLVFLDKAVKFPANDTTTPTAIEFDVNMPQDTYRFKITKKTTIEELKALKQMLKEKHNATLDFKNVDFNAQNEITSIQLTFKDANGNSKNYSTSSDSPISDIFIYRDADGRTGMGNASSRAEMEERMVEMKARMEERRTQMEVQSQERREQMQTQIEERKAQMEARMNEMKEKRAERRVYGRAQTDKDSNDKIGSKRLFSQEKPKLKLSEFGKLDNSTKPLVILDGEVISYDAMNTLDPDHIGHMNILKGEKALVAYGETAKYGAIEITTKSNPKYATIKKLKPSNNKFAVDVSGQKLFLVQGDTGIKSNANFGGVTQAKIDKDATDQDIDNIKATFQKEGITVQKTTIERNPNGEITQITLLLIGRSGNRTSSTFGNKKDPITTVWLGYTGDQ